MTKPARKKTAAEAPPFDPTPPTTVATVTQSMELTVVQTAVESMNRVNAGLAELKKRFEGVVFDVTTEQGMAEAKAARREIAAPRIEVEKIRVTAKRPILDLGAKLDAEAKRIKEELAALEDPIDSQILAEENRIKAEAEARAQAEAARVGAIMARIADIRGAPAVAARCTASADIARHLADLRAIVVDEETFAEHGATAAEALGDSIQALMEMEQAAIVREAESARLAAERAEIDKARAEQAQRDRDAVARQEAERLRVDSIRQDIAELRGNRNLTPTSGSDLIAGAIFDLENVPVTDEKFPGEYMQQAIDARAAGLAWLQALRITALAYEAEMKRQAEQRELLAAQERDRQRAASIQARMNFFNEALVRGLRMNTSQDLQRLIAEVEAKVVDASFEGFEPQALALKESALGVIRESYRAFNAREADLQLKLAREAAEQAERDRVEREEQERITAAATEEAQRLEREGPPVDDQELERVLVHANSLLGVGGFHSDADVARVHWYLRRWCKMLGLQVAP